MPKNSSNQFFDLDRQLISKVYIERNEVNVIVNTSLMVV